MGSFDHQEPVVRDAQTGMVVGILVSRSLRSATPRTLIQVLLVVLDAPALVVGADQLAQWHVSS